MNIIPFKPFPVFGVRRILPALAAAALFLCFLYPLQHQDKTGWADYMGDWMHVPLTFLLILVLLPVTEHLARRHTVRLLLALLLPVLIELAQKGTGRDAEVVDAVLGVLGGLAAVPWMRQRRIARWLLVTALTATLIPPVLLLHHEMVKQQSFPVLSVWTAPLAPLEWDYRGCKGVLVQTPERSLLVEMDGTGESYPGLFTIEHIQDWSDFKTFRAQLVSEEQSPMHVWIRFDDRPGHPRYRDRYQILFALTQGVNHVAVDLESKLVSPAGRKLNRAHMYRYGFFLEDAAGDQRFRINDIRLQHAVNTGSIPAVLD